MVKQSKMRASPSSVSKVVSRTRADSRYLRLVLNFRAGTISQYPPFFQSRMRPKQLAESVLGMQHQSIEPNLDTRAHE